MRLIPHVRCRQAMRVNFVRKFIGRWRIRWAMLFGKLQTLQSGQSVKETLKHNLKSLKDFSNNRIELLIRPLSVIETAREATSILLIGPRNENDLLIASAFFDLPLDCIRGLDLISYSKWIDVGDMHDMPYEDNQFDLVICGWTLSYSNDPQTLANEMMRVCRTGGLIAVGVEYSELDEAGYQQLLGYSLKIPGVNRINTISQIESLFASHLGTVHFSHDAPLKRCHQPDGRVANPSSVATIFSINKAA